MLYFIYKILYKKSITITYIYTNIYNLNLLCNNNITKINCTNMYKNIEI